MKTLLIMRHAKSDWGDSSTRDFDRPLNKRGKHAAPLIGAEIKKRGLTPDLILSSPAIRAKMTAESVAKSTSYSNEIIWKESFYFGYTNEIIQTIKDTDEKVEKLMIFGHNPTWSSIVEKLSGNFLSMKTADLIVLEFNRKWKELLDNLCKQTIYLSPNKL